MLNNNNNDSKRCLEVHHIIITYLENCSAYSGLIVWPHLHKHLSMSLKLDEIMLNAIKFYFEVEKNNHGIHFDMCVYFQILSRRKGIK